MSQQLSHGSRGACDILAVKYTVVNVKLYCFLFLYKCVCTRIYTVEGQEGRREVGWKHSHINPPANMIHFVTITQAHYISYTIHMKYFPLPILNIVYKFRIYKVIYVYIRFCLL